jgi:hypothetical protein
VIDLEVVAADLQQRVVHERRVREAGHDGLEVVEGLLELAVLAIGAAVLEQAAGLVLGRVLRGGQGRQEHQEQQGPAQDQGI